MPEYRTSVKIHSSGYGVLHSKIEIPGTKSVVDGLRAELWHLQKGCCAICHKQVKLEMKTKRGGVVSDRGVVDHCHMTGKARGMLCTRCNNGLGQFLDDWKMLLRASMYLRQTQIELPRRPLAVLVSAETLCDKRYL